MSGADFNVPDLPPLGPNNHPGLCLPVAAAPLLEEASPPLPLPSEPARRRRSPAGPSKRVRPLCSEEGCTKQAQNGSKCRKHGAQVKKCGAEGCENNAVKGGVCKRHGAKVDRKQCSVPDCTNNAKRGGVCIRHGAKKKKCGYAGGCDRVEHKGGLCTKHQSAARGEHNNRAPNGDARGKQPSDAVTATSRKRPREPSSEEDGGKKKQRPKCTVDGCQSFRKKGGVCVRHGAKVGNKQCRMEGCANRAKQNGVCVRHGAEQKRYEYTCTVEGCNKRAYADSPCALHGGKPFKSYAKVCSHEGCSSQAVPKYDVCIKHGGKREFKRCTVPECEKYAQRAGLCIRHGAKVKPCRIEGCTNNARRNQLCIRHGAKQTTESV